MSVTYGFYNSLNGDRSYNALQMSSLFDGIITDGVFLHIGTFLTVNFVNAMNVTVGIGKAWFNHTWTSNDAELPLTLAVSELILNRIDAVVVEVDSTESVRANSIKIIKGTPGSNPVNPAMINTSTKHQYPLAYILVEAGVTSISQAKITNAIGTTACPFITGVLESVTMEALFTQWQSQWINWYNTNTAANTATFNTWFNNLQSQLSGNVAANLQIQIDRLTMLDTRQRSWFL